MTDTATRAIETSYNGYRFRSRLEARWAVFWDALSIKYGYETEGYDLGALGWYLPDFWLSDLGMWAEIKPNVAAWTTGAVEKLAELVKRSDAPGLAIAGLPSENWTQLLAPNPLSPRGVVATTATWVQCLGCGHIAPQRSDADSMIGRAMDRAKAARFEFGEHG